MAQNARKFKPDGGIKQGIFFWQSNLEMDTKRISQINVKLISGHFLPFCAVIALVLINGFRYNAVGNARIFMPDGGINQGIFFWESNLEIDTKRISQIDVNLISGHFCAVIGFNLVLASGAL